MSSLQREDVLQRLRAHRTELDQFGVKSIALFGSVARGDAGPGSDLDVLVELRRATFDAYMGLKLFLEDLFGTAVDVVMLEALRPPVRERVLVEAVDVAA